MRAAKRDGRRGDTRSPSATLDDGLLDWYLATGEWRERAGGYAIQGAAACSSSAIEGDYLNVVGLPVGSACAALRRICSLSC